MKVNQPKILKIGDKVWVKNEENIHRGWEYIIMEYLINNELRLYSSSGTGRNIEINRKYIFHIN